MTRSVRLTSLAILVAAHFLVACEGQGPILVPVDAGTDRPPDKDAGVSPADEIIALDRIVENFDSRWLVQPEQNTEVIIDTNRGVATLLAESFPRVTASSIAVLDTNPAFEGVVEASSIIVEADVEIEATDAAELRAADTIRIAGNLRAGKGGVTLIAGQAIFIDGLIESEGPVRLRVSSEEGLVDISGKVVTVAAVAEASSSISVVTRGSVRVTGELRSGSSESDASGEVTISSYRSIEIRGTEAIVASGPSDVEMTGRVALSSELDILLMDQAVLSTGRGDLEAPTGEPADQAGGGDIELRAVGSIQVSNDVRLGAGSAVEAKGGSLVLVAGESVSVERSELKAGSGLQGGRVQIEARTATVGPQTLVESGGGEFAGGEVSVSTAHDLILASGSFLRGGDSACGRGGDVALLVGGALVLRSEVVLRGGAGGSSPGSCTEPRHPGGSVRVTAQSAQAGAIEAAVFPGPGAPLGTLVLLIDREYSRPLPEVRVRRTGELLSKIFDRGVEGIGHIPVMIEQRVTTPSGTFAKIQLAGESTSDGPFDVWYDAADKDASLLAPLASARYLRYRIWLQGRALDAPEIDYFELDLVP